MKRYKVILAVAPWGRDDGILRHVAHFAQAAQADAVHVVHAAAPHDDKHVAAMQPPYEDILDRLRALVAQYKGCFPARTRLEPAICSGSVVPEVVHMAAMMSADLICLPRLAQDAEDPITEVGVKILRKAPCSTFLIPANAGAPYARVLVPVDFSETSREALEVAVAVASSSPNSHISVLHVYSLPTNWATALRIGEIEQAMKEHAVDAWQKLSGDVDFKGIPHELMLRESQWAPRGIMAAAGELEASMIVLGSHGLTKPATVLLGHVVDIVASKTRYPVLCVKRKGQNVGLLDSIKNLFNAE